MEKKILFSPEAFVTWWFKIRVIRLPRSAWWFANRMQTNPDQKTNRISTQKHIRAIVIKKLMLSHFIQQQISGYYFAAVSKSRQRKNFLKKISLRFSGIFEKNTFGIGDAKGELPL